MIAESQIKVLSMKSSIAIITARGGSKRIPRKNIRAFCGKPMIAYSIEAALACGEFQKVIVSTDDAEIAQISEKYGASVPFMRSAKTSDDFATTADVLQEVLSSYKEKFGGMPTLACCIYPTAPLIQIEPLREAMDMLRQSKSTLSVVSIVKFGFPIQRAFKMNQNHISYMTPEFADRRSQDLEPAYHDAGQFYCFDVREFTNKGVLIDGTSKGIELSEMSVQDIDTETDWAMAELKWKLQNQKI